MKKIAAIFIFLFLLLPIGQGFIFAEETGTSYIEAEHVNNSGFERLSGGVPNNWSFSGDTFGNGFSIDSTDAYGGSNSLKINTTASSVYASQSVKTLIGGETYRMRFGVKVVRQNGKGAEIKLEFKAKDSLGNITSSEVRKTYTDITKGSWQNLQFDFTAPEGITQATLLVRYYGGGEVFYDDVSIIGASVGPVFKEAADGVSNIVPNSNMEQVKNNMPYHWYGSNASMVSMATDNPHSGTNSIKISTESSSADPSARVTVDGMIENAEYQTTAWIKTSSADDVIKFKWEFRRNTVSVGDYFIVGYHSEEMKALPGVWQKVVMRTVAPPETTCMYLHVRLIGSGEVYFDDVEVCMTELPPKMDVESDVFHYSDWETGTVKASLNPYYAVPAGATVDFVLKDGDTVLSQQPGTAVSADAEFNFDLDLLSVLGKEYTVDVIYKDAEGNLLDQKTHAVYKYNRPSILNEDGNIIKNNKIFTPVIGYHVPVSLLPEVSRAGVNTVQSDNAGGATSTNIPVLLDYLDAAYENNIMVMVVLYPGMVPAGNPDNIQKTKDCVTAVKDHPALLGYMVMDEPYNHLGVNGTTINEIEEWLKVSYKIIRDIDPVHVVYATHTEYRQERSVNYVDVLGRDPYPTGNNLEYVHTYVADKTKSACLAAGGKKPVWVINAATSVAGGYTPNANEVRHMAYQALFAGAKGLGWYNIKAGTGVNIPLPIWRRTGIWEGVECFAQREQEDAFKHFITGEYPIFNSQQGENDSVWWRSFKKENEYYFVILNRENEENTISIPLISDDGEEEINSFRAEAADITDSPDVSSFGTLSVTLSPGQVVRYKVTPTPYIRSSYDITSPSGGASLLAAKRSDFENAVIGTDWVISDSSITGVNAEIITGDAPAPGGGQCLKMTSEGNTFYTYRIMQENQNTAKDAPASGKILDAFSNSTLLTGRATDTLRVSALVKTEDLEEGVLPYIEVSFSAASTLYNTYDFQSKPIDTNGEWKEIDCVYKVPDYVAGRPRNYQIRLYLPGEGTVYWDHVRIWTDDFNYYGPQNAASTLTELTAGTVYASYEPIDSAHAVGDTVQMLTCLYETIGNTKELVSVSVDSTTKTAGEAIQLVTMIEVPESSVRKGTSIETFLLDSVTGMKPVARKEILKKSN